MEAFRFRAQAALDLRRREHDEAQRVLARARAGVAASRAALQGAVSAVADAREQAVRAQSSATDAGRLGWYRSWIVRLEYERTAAVNVVLAREAEAEKAQGECHRARQAVEALERFAAKSRAAWERALRAEEQKQMDMLATLRFAARRHYAHR